MNIIENNKLIAEFLGYVNTTPNDKDFSIYEGNTLNIKGNVKNLIEPMSMEFHSDWNWLMAVVTEIRTYKYPSVSDTTCLTLTNEIVQLAGRARLEATYNACINFIKWHNNKTK
jgi:hypothetical protein